MKSETLLKRNDGSEVKIVCELFTNISQLFSIGTFVLARKSPTDDWHYCSESDGKSIKECGSVANYIKHGRSTLMSTVRPHELLKATQEFKSKVIDEFGVMAKFV
ncbi:hypothetical protein [Vibrio sp. D431a]|uniref:hypothetical protein n=1 Tax=Vibrio sp. D431a TaxID=2837388 RepID=UPI002557AF85|nr:hypothetical protein [Vibrio sp. D431a]MDK9793771.1 hypothetical protein [Vibrio sp. D431a]